MLHGGCLGLVGAWVKREVDWVGMAWIEGKKLG